MRQTLNAALAALLLLALTAIAWAERRQEEKKEATDVITGTVKKIKATEEKFGDTGVLTEYVAEIKVTAVERGKNAKVGDTILIRWSHVTKRPTEALPGAYGHKYDVKEGSTIRAYLIKRKDSKDFDVIYNPAGIEKAGREAEQK